MITTKIKYTNVQLYVDKGISTSDKHWLESNYILNVITSKSKFSYNEHQCFKKIILITSLFIKRIM